MKEGTESSESVLQLKPAQKVVELLRPWILFASMRFYSFKRASHTKRFQVFETAATVCLLVLAVGVFVLLKSWVGLVYWAVAASLSATIPLWAAYLPHRLAPEHPTVRTAGRIAQIWTPVIPSFAFHHLHHAFPRVPTALLPVLASREEAREYKAHIHEEAGV